MSRASGAAELRGAAPLFAALGDETRLALLRRLSARGPDSTARLGARANVTHQAVTKHLEVLSAAGLVRSRRRGRERIWELEPKRLEVAHDYLDRISARWDEALARLKTFVEEE